MSTQKEASSIKPNITLDSLASPRLPETPFSSPASDQSPNNFNKMLGDIATQLFSGEPNTIPVLNLLMKGCNETKKVDEEEEDLEEGLETSDDEDDETTTEVSTDVSKSCSTCSENRVKIALSLVESHLNLTKYLASLI